MITLIVDEEGRRPVVIRYHINLLGEIEPRFPLFVQWSDTLLKYYNRVLIQHVEDMQLERELKDKYYNRVLIDHVEDMKLERELKENNNE